RVTTNACLDELRRRRRRPVLGLPDDEPELGPGRPVGQADAGIDGLGDRMAIERALADLPIEFRAPVVPRDLCDLDYAEIGTTLGIPAGTVRSRIARGRAQLARSLTAGNRDPLPRRPTATTTSEPELGSTP